VIGSFRSRCRKLALSECLGLHFKIDLCIDMGGIERNMSQPSTDRIDVDTGAQQMYRGGVANGVWTDLLGRQGRQLLTGSLCRSFDKGVDSEPCEGLLTMVEKDGLAWFSPDDKRSQFVGRLWP